MAFKYQPLIQGEFIRRCDAILSNKTQCPRAGEFHVLSEDGKPSHQQICARCKALQEADFAEAPQIYPTYEPEEKKLPSLAEIKKEDLVPEQGVIAPPPPAKEAQPLVENKGTQPPSTQASSGATAQGKVEPKPNGPTTTPTNPAKSTGSESNKTTGQVSTTPTTKPESK